MKLNFRGSCPRRNVTSVGIGTGLYHSSDRCYTNMQWKEERTWMLGRVRFSILWAGRISSTWRWHSCCHFPYSIIAFSIKLVMLEHFLHVRTYSTNGGARSHSVPTCTMARTRKQKYHHVTLALVQLFLHVMQLL